MEWTITLNEKSNYAEIITSGIADKNGSMEMAKAISMVMRKSRINKVLIDHRNIRAVSGRIVEIYHRPDEYKKIGVPHDIMVAEVVKPKHREFFDFLETVCVNRSYLFSVFWDRKSALEWLLTP